MMMKPTTILMDEHRVIEQVLGCLEKMVTQSQAGAALNEQQAHNVVDFLRNFADRCHHGKEEAHLFPMLEARGFPRQGGPTGVMLQEHEQGRVHVQEMSEAIAAAEAGDAAARRRFFNHADAYIDLLRNHIQKEDHCLFAMADNALSEQDQNELLRIFDRVEHEEIGEGIHEKYLKIADELAAAYQVPRMPLTPGHEGHGCSHHHH
jgi:hemerythrin-like domain-containing protein